MKNKIYLLIGGLFLISLFVASAYIMNSVDDTTKLDPDVSAPNNIGEIIPETPISTISKPDISLPNPQVIENEPLSFIMPVSGEIGLQFSPGTLIYSKTLKEWVTHNGIDILSDAGTPVIAAESGLIKEINDTPKTGIEIIIQHDNGYKTVYSNLSTAKMVKIGEKIKKAQTISGIGRTSAFEYHEPDHLHFEVYKDGIVVNPLSVIKED